MKTQQTVSKAQVEAESKRLGTRLSWQAKWFRNMKFGQFQELLRRAELYKQLLARMDEVASQQSMSEITAGEAWKRVLKSVEDIRRVENSLVDQDSAVHLLWQSLNTSGNATLLDGETLERG